jgi:regulator of RNase E activity RraB
LVNLRFVYEDPRDENGWVHHALIRMVDAGPHGMGSQAEMERLTPIEDAVFDRAEAAGAQPVGRLRNAGVWQLSVYGPAELPLGTWVRDAGQVEVELHSQPDSDFQYLNEFLLPDSERQQWIMDRRVCDQLQQHGDEPSVPRPVDHYISYEESAPAELVEAVKALGFDVTDDGSGLECVKVHAIQLETVHDIAMSLSQLADEHDASYDGWGCEVTKAAGPAN